MRHPLAIALASLFVAALIAPSAQAATRRYDFQDFHGSEDFLPGHIVAIHIAVFYKSKHGRYTPRQAMYDSLVPYSCNPPVSGTGRSGPGPISTGQRLQLDQAEEGKLHLLVLV